MSNKGNKGTGKTLMSKQAASRIQGATAMANGGKVSKGGFPARAAAAAARNKK